MADKGKTRARTKPKERYLAIPYHILNLGGIALAQKVLLSHIYSFAAKGCRQSNKTLAEIERFKKMFGSGPRRTNWRR